MRAFITCGTSSLLLAGARAFTASPGESSPYLGKA
ncbi:unnamed protein product [Ectocarpus fasciculatus]